MADLASLLTPLSPSRRRFAVCLKRPLVSWIDAPFFVYFRSMILIPVALTMLAAMSSFFWWTTAGPASYAWLISSAGLFTGAAIVTALYEVSGLLRQLLRRQDQDK